METKVWLHQFNLLWYLSSVAIAISCSQRSQVSKICDLETCNSQHIKPAVLDNIYMQVPSYIPPNFLCSSVKDLTSKHLKDVLVWTSCPGVVFPDSITQLVKKIKKLWVKNCFLNDLWFLRGVDSSAKILIQCCSNSLPVEVEECQTSQDGCVCRLCLHFFSFTASTSVFVKQILPLFCLRTMDVYFTAALPTIS